jgi:DedD protein
MYCTTCELEIKGDDKDTCPVCGGPLSESQEADSALDNQDRKEETGVEGIFNDSESSAVSEPEPASDGSGQEEVFVLKDYDPDSLNADTAATSTGGSDELPLLNEPAQGSTHNVDDLLDSIRESIATPEHPEEDGVSAAEESSELDRDFSFFDSDRQDTSTTVPSEKTMEQGTEISWGYDEAATAASMPEAPERKRSPAFKVVLIVVLLAVGGYYAFTLTSDDAGSDDVVSVRTVMPLAALQTDKKQKQSAGETLIAPGAAAVEERVLADEEPISPLADGDDLQAAEINAQQSDASVEPEELPASAPVVAEDDTSAPAFVAVETDVPVEPEELPIPALVVVEDDTSASVPVAVEINALVEPKELPAPAPVAIEDSTPAQVKPVPAAPVAKQIRAPFFTVHVGSYRKQVSAATEVDRIKAKGYDAFIERVDLPKIGIWYRVKVGRFENRAEAEQLQKKIQKVLVADSRVVTQQTD